MLLMVCHAILRQNSKFFFAISSHGLSVCAFFFTLFPTMLPSYKVFSVWRELELFLPSVQTVRLGPPDPIDVTQTSSGRSKLSQ